MLHVFGDEERRWKEQGMDAISYAATLRREVRAAKFEQSHLEQVPPEAVCVSPKITNKSDPRGHDSQ